MRHTRIVAEEGEAPREDTNEFQKTGRLHHLERHLSEMEDSGDSFPICRSFKDPPQAAIDFLGKILHHPGKFPRRVILPGRSASRVKCQ